MGVEFDVDAFIDLVQARGDVVCHVAHEGGGPGHGGSAGVIRFGGLFWAYDDNAGFGGPHQSLAEALGEEHLAFGDVRVSVTVSGMAASTYARMMTVDAPEGAVVKINDAEWVLDGEGRLRPPPRQKKGGRKRRPKAT